MDPNYVPLITIGVICLAIVFRLIAGRMDRERIEGYALSNRWELLDTEWTPFGTGWMGSQNERIYTIRYRDREGIEHEATCKTSMMAGVYLTEDHTLRRPRATTAKPAARPPVVRPPATRGPEDELARLRAENRRLREKLAAAEEGGT